MKPFAHFPFLSAALLLGLAGCTPREARDILAEGPLYTVSYRLPDGRTGGFTRVNHAQAVPGGNGSWNVKTYGRLTRDFLIVTRAEKESSELGPEFIPVHRLLHIQFADGTRTVWPEPHYQDQGPDRDQ